MASTTTQTQVTGVRRIRVIDRLAVQLAETPVLSYLLGALVAVGLEAYFGYYIARLVGLRRAPVLFGSIAVLENFGNLDLSGILSPLIPASSAPAEPWAMSGRALINVLRVFISDIPPALLTLLQVLAYDIIIFVLPILVVGLLARRPVRWVVTRVPFLLTMLLQLVLLYIVIRIWGSLSDYRNLVLMFIGINVILTISLNLINGYMGEFSVGHAAFMAVGAYVSAVLTMWLFTNNAVFGEALLPWVTSLPFGIGNSIGFIFALLVGGLAAALVSLLVAIPSFRTRGDYLAIVTLALLFIVLSFINNLNAIGGARGLNGVPLWSTVTWVYVFTLLALFTVRNLVNSTFGKGIIAIREDEIAANLMSVNTKRVKLVAFMYSSFLAGIAGGLFAHVLAYVNPGTFGILKSTEVLVMVYLGGMGSITGSVVAAVLFTILLEALRPLGVLKWVIIPLILILLMLFRPQGLFGNREIKLNWGSGRRAKKDMDYEASLMEKDASDAIVTD